MAFLRHPASRRGAYRDRHGRWVRDAVDADNVKRRMTLICGRRSRVVLTPRRWRQACGRYPAGDGGKKARSPRRSRRKPLKPLRREGRVFRRTCGDYARVLYSLRTRGCGCNGHPAFPAPSSCEGHACCTTRGALVARGSVESHHDKLRHCEPTGRANARPMTGSAKQSIPPGPNRDCFVAALLAMTANWLFEIRIKKDPSREMRWRGEQFFPRGGASPRLSAN